MTFRNVVNTKFPPGMASNNTRVRRINEVSRNTSGVRFTGYGRGRGRGRGGRNNGRGRGNFSGRGQGRGRGSSRGHPDARFITGTNGKTIEIHPSYNFPPNIWDVIPYAERRKITEERSQYSNNKRQKISSVGSIPPAINLNDDQSQSMVGSIMGHEPPNHSVNSNRNQMGSIMGGRNEQASMRSHRSNNN